jgi:small-conductance mechanosensitive channel
LEPEEARLMALSHPRSCSSAVATVTARASGYTVTAAGVTGIIKSIDLRKSCIVAEDGKLHVVPNKAVETATWVVEARGETEKTEGEKEE